MAINCSICGKKQSGWIQDFSLSQEHPDEKICVKCNEQLQNLINSNDKNASNNGRKYFQNYIAESQISSKSKEYLEALFKLESNCKTGKSIGNILKNEIANKIYSENEQFQKAKKNVKMTTGCNFEGYRIIQYIDVIFEEKIIGVGIKTSLKSLGDIFASLTGEEMHALTSRITELKDKIKDSLKEKTINLGANALIGIDFETTLPGNSAIMVAINGTAVIIEKE